MENELTYDQIDEFFAAPDEWEIEIVDSKILNSVDMTKTLDLLINKLDSDDGQIRYIAAHIILIFKLEVAKDKLIERILSKKTYNRNGTMTYALGHLNCSENLVSVFKILATQSYESKLHAYNILCEQEFEFTESDLSDLTEIWNKLKSNQDDKSELDSEIFEMIREAYEGFIKYIEVK